MAFSGGLGSTVLLDQVRKLYPNTPALFVNTGIEYPEIVSFVKTIDNVTIMRPHKTNFKKVIDKYGYPIFSKKIAMGFDRHRNTPSEEQKQLRLHGGVNPTSGKKQHRSIPVKHHHLVNAPFNISDRCCYFLKKKQFKKYQKETGRKPIQGIMAEESFLRKGEALRTGCNIFNTKAPISSPMLFWRQVDLWAYIEKYDLPYSKIYDMGEKRTGCMWCLFGIDQEPNPNRFQRMAITHPKHYDICINKLRIGEVLDYINIDYTPKGAT